jgi:hypothetical protein
MAFQLITAIARDSFEFAHAPVIVGATVPMCMALRLSRKSSVTMLAMLHWKCYARNLLRQGEKIVA